jgi:cryptochrome
MASFLKVVDSLGDPVAPAQDPPAALPAPAPSALRCGDTESSVPSLAELGYPAEGGATPFRGGETVALARMADYLSDHDWVAKFEKPKGNPAAFSPRPSTTVLSPYLKFGCLSPRLFHAKVAAIYRLRAGHTQPPVSLRGQLLWREFFYCAAAATPNFGRMEGNAVCRQVTWQDNEDFVKAWEESRTG